MKILVIASGGGHWVELLRLMPAFEDMDVVYVSTMANGSSTVPGQKFYCIPDANRWNKLKLTKIFLNVHKIISLEKPDVILSTGAAPGLMGVISGRMSGIRTIWIDSIASTQKLSLSGRIALKFVDRFYTQWPDLASPRIVYAGNVLS